MGSIGEGTRSVKNIFEMFSARYKMSPDIDLVKGWLVYSKVLDETQLEAFLLMPLKYREYMNYGLAVDWFELIGSKFRKLAITEFVICYFRKKNPRELKNVGVLSHTVGICGQEMYSTVAELMRQRIPGDLTQKEAKRIFDFLLGTLLVYDGHLQPAKMVAHVVNTILLTLENVSQISTYLNYFYPQQTFHDASDMKDRIRLLYTALELRGYVMKLRVLAAELDQACPPSSREGKKALYDSTEKDELQREWAVVGAEVCFRYIKTLTRVKLDLRSPYGKQLTDEELPTRGFITAIVAEAGVCRDESLDTNRKKKKTKSSTSFRAMTPSDMGMIARTIKKILRLDDPYDTYLQKEGYWEDILSPDNEGWIPLSVVKMCLQSKMDHVNLPFESNDFLVPFLTNHDNLSRFELGKCDCPNSRFRNQQCARAVYAHMSLNLHIYRYIICKPPHRLQSHTPSPDVPHYAWFLCEHERVKAFLKREHYALYGIPFVQCMSTESVWDCWNYKVTTSQAEQLDEKLYSSKVYFVEVDLHSIVQDANIDIYRRQNLNSSNYFWYIFPKYFVEEGGLTVEEGDDSDGKEAETQTKVLPQHHLTGRFAILGDDKCKEGAIRVFKNTISDDDFMQCHLYREEAAMSDISRARGTPYEFSNWKEEDGDAAQTNTVMYTFALDAATRRDLLEGRVNTTSLAVVDGPLDASTEIDTDGIKSEIKKFLADAERVVLQISVPLKDTNGNNIKNRSEAIKKIKEWAEGQDLVWRRSGTSADETVPERSESNSYFEVQKRSGWTKTELLTVVEEIGLPEMKSHLDRIKEAVTRHCENSQENYETMEFVGDAVLDLIAVVDTFLANFLFKCKVEKSVVTDLLNNDVLGHLLPRSVDTHLEKMYGASIQWKTKADMLEALIGAAYYSKIGLDSIRKLVFNRFALLGDNMGGPHHLDSTTGELKEVLQVARKRCVYTKVRYEDLEQHHQFKCFQIIEIPLCEKYFPEDDNSRKNFSTHRAAVRLPRVQAKQYATHFTTGPMYSYRRVPSLDTPVLLNRILSQHKAGEVAYINEVILPRTHVVVDFDGKDIRSHDILRYFRDWYTHKFGCDAAMLIVDCTGLSVVTKKNEALLSRSFSPDHGQFGETGSHSVRSTAVHYRRHAEHPRSSLAHVRGSSGGARATAAGVLFLAFRVKGGEGAPVAAQAGDVGVLFGGGLAGG
ncbi:hypothetical protein AGDE_14022 [Angomonas deanei]|uniref:La HTH in kinetoplastid DICER domain/KptA in kinetoplastid DICER domain/Prim-pol 4, putative n=1 Tax=Angomonas deanei TaxID=59799 RepID=A0A7G2CGZ0_9TRYP|nr:hypothetical protein AGDE_14022 [Angomonas deanei]CAD2219148.1 La HTH in kinetoplastid DICER domain/KptA in kinetoplastid DICER domain/Prim-pol 4, putative [Angomonas deanei]|eukprot:EPY21542.1 hypothetical protein AGDE_14022 [Angomonas deanei]